MRRRRFLAILGTGSLAGCAADESSTPAPGPLPAQYREETVTVTGGEPAGTSASTTRPPSTTDAPGTTEPPASTATDTPAPDPPEISDVALVDEWEEVGDIDTGRLDSLRPGALVAGAARFSIPTHDGRVLARVGARITRGDDTLVDEGTERVEDDADGTGPVEREAAVDFATGPWRNTTHTLEMQVTDEVTGLSSDPATTTFEVLEAAGSN